MDFYIGDYIIGKELLFNFIYKLKIKMNCQFKNFSEIFGIPNEGVHSYRFMNLAIVDVLSTIIGAFIIARIFNWNFFLTLLVIFILGIILHRLFCVNTTINKFIFGVL